MKRHLRIHVFVCLSVPLLVLASACRESGRRVVGVVPKSKANSFWLAVHAGAVAAAEEADMDIIWNGPAQEADFSHQVAIVDDLINRQVTGILVAPSDQNAMVPVIERAHRSGIPLIIFDSGANAENYVSYVATDNYGGGVLAARRMAEILGEKGEVAMVGVLPGSASGVARENGFRETLEKEFPEVKLVAFQYGMADRAKSLAVAEDFLTAHPDLDGIFGSAEPGSIGAVQAVKNRGLAGKVKIIGFDTSPTLVEDLESGVIDSLVMQDPFTMAYRAFKTLEEKLEGGTPPRRINLPPVLATSENFREPDIFRLIDPQAEIDRYLK